MSTLFSFVATFRLPLILLFNTLVWSFGYLFSLALRFDSDFSEMSAYGRIALPLSFLLFFRSGTYIYWSLNQGFWRYVSLSDLEKIIKAHLVSSVMLAASVWLSGLPAFPRSVILIEFAVSVLLCAGSRAVVRLFLERGLLNSSQATHADSRDVIVLGAGESGHMLVKHLLGQRRLSYRPLFVLDDNPHLQGLSVYGIKVMGKVSDLEEVLKAYPSASVVLLAIPSITTSKQNSIEAICKQFGVPLKHLQAFEDIALSDAMEPKTSLSIETVLEREMHVEHEQEIKNFISGKSVVVTGAAGSIGSELVRQILPFRPKKLVLIDNNEFHMYKVKNETAAIEPEVERHCVIASINDAYRLDRIFEQHAPEIVFHAAAYKHVPLLEENVYEAFVNNIIGTRNLLQVSFIHKVKKFVLISTDKAVNSCSVMGHSKRISELLVQSFSRLSARGASPMTATIVRFGNVINSNGSVVPLFKQQILSGGPVTVTHPDMRRFFMSISEAVRLVLAAAPLGEGSEIFMLDMGKPVKVIDVAQKMLALYGRRDIPIVFTGIRPGERLFEELIGEGEETRPTVLRKIHRVVSSFVPELDVREWTAKVEQKLHTLSDEQLRALIADYVSGKEERDTRKVSGR